ncbi:guanosine-diphosphatase [Aureococcus anophagefferens]|nr:guanosine-diphosphatase [Aureococcus anophagefferens]
MGAGASTEGQTAETLTLARTASKGREKYLAAEDVTDLDSAKEEIKRLRGLLTATFDANDNGVVDFGEMKHHVSVENGHHVIDALVATSGPAFAALVGATSNAPETSFDLGFIADQDQDSRAMKDAAGKENDEATLTTAFATARLTYLGDGDVRYKFELVDDTLVSVGTHKDDSDKSGRGAEYSLLEWYGGKLRAGKFLIKPVENDGKRVRVLLGDGSKNKGLKTEWSTIKDGKLLIGSTGKERTDDDGNVVHKGEMWIKALDEAFAVTDIDWSTQYGALRAAAQCPHGAGYMIHDRQPYDEVIDEAKCCNLMLACDDDFDASKVIAKPALTFLPLRGCSDFLYVPGTNDSHIFVIRTEETIDGEVGTFCSVIDIAGKVLMPEMLFGKQRKFEGCCLIADFMKTKPAY